MKNVAGHGLRVFAYYRPRAGGTGLLSRRRAGARGVHTGAAGYEEGGHPAVVLSLRI